MTVIYLIRHCEAEGNVKRLVQGVIDTEITETGAKQLEFLAERFKNVHIDKVYSSSLKRTRATAHAIADSKKLDVITADDFIEINCGRYEGVPFDELFKDENFRDIWVNHPQNMAIEGGETQRAAYERIWKAVNRLAQENKGKTIAVATHGGVLRALFCRLKFGTVERLAEMPYADNTAVSLLKVDENGKVEIEFYYDISHLPEEFLPEHSRVPSIQENE